jgi:hypothetical protein
MRTLFKVMIVPAILSLSLIACDNGRQDRNNENDDVRNSTTGSYRSIDDDNNVVTDDYAASRDKVTTGWNTRLDEINRELEEMDRKIDNEKSESKQAWQERRSKLKEEKDVLEDRIDRAGDTSEKDWDQFKNDVDNDLDRLGNNVKNLFRDNDKETPKQEKK